MNRRRLPSVAALLIVVLIPGGVAAAEFSGGGASMVLGLGTPNSVDAATALANDLAINDERGNVVLGLQGFYQGDRYRLGGTAQAHAWGGINPGKDGADDDAAGVGAFIVGLYVTHTIAHDRMLLNVGGIAGAGRCLLGYSLGGVDRDESVTAFLLEPHISLGVAEWRWFGVEFQLSAPIFLLTEDLTLTEGGTTYTVKNGDMIGVNFSLKLTFGKIADFAS